MRSLTLITVYLSKDIWQRWVETPGAVLARLFIATALCLLFLLIQAGFLISERAVEKKIKGFGLNTLIVRSHEVDKKSQRPEIDKLFINLSNQGTYLPFALLYAQAKLQNGQKAKVIVYSTKSLPGLLKIIPSIKNLSGNIFLAAHGLPETLPERARIGEFFFDCEVVEPPPILRFISSNQPVLFIPDTVAKNFHNFSQQETILFVSRNSSELPEIIESVEALLKSEGFDRLDITSPLKWIGELDGLKELRIKAQAIGGSVVGLFIMLIFGSISIFEYRQNIFSTALFKSFGLSSLNLALRYFFEGLLILITSFFIASQLAQSYHNQIFKLAGFDHGLLYLDDYNPYQTSHNLILLLLLSATAFISILPICAALRKPVGKVLG